MPRKTWKGAIRIPLICKAIDNSVRRVIPMHSVMLHYPDDAIIVAGGEYTDRT